MERLPIDDAVQIPDITVPRKERDPLPENHYLRKQRKMRIRGMDVVAIKRYFGWAYTQRLPRCNGKAKMRVLALEAQGDFSHSAKDHLCAICQCRHTAGAGTYGDWYGLGPQTGHYGAGWCYFHEMKVPRGNANAYAARCIKDMRRGSLFHYKSNAPYLKEIEDDAKEADDRITVRAELNLLRSKLQEFEDKCTRGPKQEGGIVLALHELGDKIDALTLIQNQEEVKHCLRDVRDAIDDRIFEETNLTESSKNGPVRASDATRYKLAAMLGKTISKIAIDNMHLNEVNYVLTDDVKIRAQQTVALTFRILETHGTKEQWIEGYKEIWSNLKTVNQKR